MERRAMRQVVGGADRLAYCDYVLDLHREGVQN
jgi:hypothetical protein